MIASINAAQEKAPMAKTVTFAIVHMTVAFAVGYLLTGSLMVGSALALVEPAINTVAYFFHEKIWERIRRKQNGGLRQIPQKLPLAVQ